MIFFYLRVDLFLRGFFGVLSGLIKSADESNKLATDALLMPPLYFKYPIEFGVKYVLKTYLYMNFYFTSVVFSYVSF